ncbi:RHS repeat domain-containing protein [Caproiciproducens sp.]
MSYANGTAWFDCLQLETGSIANIYNLLENGDFRLSANYLPTNWEFTNFTSGDGMSNGNVRIGGNPTLNKNFYQQIYINKPASSIAFVVSAKSTGSSVPTGRDGRYYAIDVGLYYTDGDSEFVVVPFNPDTNGEQYTSGPVAASQDRQISGKIISKVIYHIIYYKNANEATFKFLQMNMDETGTTFAYDSNGKLVTSAQNTKNTRVYTYTDAQELRDANIKNNATNFNQGYIYFYDSDDSNSSTKKPHRLVSARSAQTGIGFHYYYDNYGNVGNTSMGSISEEGYVLYDFPYLETLQNFSPDGNYLTSSSDQREKMTTYSVDTTTGLTNSVTDPKGNTTNYTYNTQNNLLMGVSALSSAGLVETAYEYDVADRLSQITHNGFAYAFQKDGYGNTTAISVGTQNLITNTFAPGNGNLQSSTYGNGFKLGYLYDSYDRVNMVLKNDNLTYEYLYDARGNLAKITEYDQGSIKSINFYYDIGDRLIRKLLSDGSEIQYVYDNMDRPTRYVYTFANQSKSATADYSVDYRKHNTYMLSGGEITHAYDATLNREFQTDINPIPLQDPTFRAERSFVNVLNAKTTTLVDTYYNHRRIGDVNSTLSQYHYTYDDNGNISSTTDINGNVTTYAYDQLNQLVRVDDQKAGVSTVYSYDVGGNITAITTYAYTTGTLGTETGSIAYDYGNTNWKDLLTGYDGQNITYDAIGNPLTYRDGMSFTWAGRQLKSSIVNNQDVEYTIEYTYDSNGIRTSRTVNGVTTNYFLDGSTIVAQRAGSDVLWFLYDSDNTLVGFTYNGTAYYYTKNAQGDVTGIVDSNVNLVVEYAYDAWGKLLSITDNSADQVGQKSPFRYRGYYYDSETGLYCLNSRYYDPQTGRFLNADAQIGANQDIRDYNLFAYCGNNPVNRSDLGGLFWKEIGDWFKSVGTAIVNFANATFGASSSAVIQEEPQIPPIIPDPYPITVKPGTRTTTTVSEQGSSSKLISVYAIGVSDNTASSSVGLKINVPNFTLNISFGLNNTGVSGSIKNGTASNSFGLRASLAELKLRFESATTAQLSDKSNQTNYLNVSVSGMFLAAAAIFVQTGQPIGSLQPS